MEISDNYLTSTNILVRRRSAPPLPASLMGPNSGPIHLMGNQPILISNQSSMPNTIVTGNQPIFTLPQTFTIPVGQPIEVRQNQSM